MGGHVVLLRTANTLAARPCCMLAFHRAPCTRARSSSVAKLSAPPPQRHAASRSRQPSSYSSSSRRRRRAAAAPKPPCAVRLLSF